MALFNRTRILLLTLAAATASSFPVFSEQDNLPTSDKKAAASCTYNKSTPIIPDGNIATKDELVSAQTRIKEYQESLQDFRACLLIAEQSLDVDSEHYESDKAALLARNNESVALETKVANQFNSAINIYKSR